jgi:hypothetical protein
VSCRRDRVGRQSCLAIFTKTNKSRRWVPIAAPLVKMLGEIHVDARKGPVVAKWENVRRDLTAIVRAYNRAEEENAKEEKRQPRPATRNVSPNDLRRTFASWLKQASVDSVIVAKMLGHTTSRLVELVHGHLDGATRRQRSPAAPRLRARRRREGTVARRPGEAPPPGRRRGRSPAAGATAGRRTRADRRRARYERAREAGARAAVAEPQWPSPSPACYR